MPTTPPTITPLPDPPNPNDRSTFNTRAYPWSVAQQTFGTELAAVATNAFNNATDSANSATTAGTQATNASTSASAAAASAATAINAPGTSATSATSLALSAGTKNLTLAQTGKAFANGQQVKLSRAAAPTTRMFGAITAFNSGTGAMTVEVPSGAVEGTGGPYTDWEVALGVAVVSSTPPERKTRSITAADTAVVADRQKVLVFTGASALTLAFDPVATLTDGWFVEAQNASAFAWTLDPSGSEQIDGAATLVLQPGEVREVRCTGTALATIKVYDSNSIIVRDEKTNGTGGGSATAATWQTRTLNTVVANTIAGASLASNQVTLPPGNYMVRASAPAMGVDGHQIRLWSVTGSAILLRGTSESANSTAPRSTSRSTINLPLTLAAATVVRLDHYTGSAPGAASDLGGASASGAGEVYAEIEIRKVG